MTNEERVREFMAKAEQRVPEHLEWPTDYVLRLRLNLIKEEFKELEEATLYGNIESVADAIADLLYVVYGTGIAFGLPVQEVFEEIHRSNMTKFTDGFKDPRSGKWIKGPSWSPPNLEPILKHGPESVP